MKFIASKRAQHQWTKLFNVFHTEIILFDPGHRVVSKTEWCFLAGNALCLSSAAILEQTVCNVNIRRRGLHRPNFFLEWKLDKVPLRMNSTTKNDFISSSISGTPKLNNTKIQRHIFPPVCTVPRFPRNRTVLKLNSSGFTCYFMLLHVTSLM